MHTLSPQLQITALERLVAADGVASVLNSAGDWVDLGLVDAMAIWIRDRQHDLLRLAHVRGLPESLGEWRAGPPSPHSPLWSALERVEPSEIDVETVPLGLAVPLKECDATQFSVHPIRDPEGSPYGVVLVGLAPHASRRDLRQLPWSALGAALHRACTTDSWHWRADWLDAIIPLLTDGLIVAGPDGELHAYSPSMRKMVGWTEADVRKHGWMSLVYPDPKEREAVSRALAALFLGEPSRGTVRPMATSFGTQAQVEVYSAIVPHPSGGSPAVLGLMRDVTQARAEARQRARDDALTRLGRMTGGVAHEFNNLLGAIMGHAELIATANAADEATQRRARMVVAAAQRGGVLSRQLLAFSGATVSRIVPVPTPTLMAELTELYRPSLPRGLALDIDTSGCRCAIEADPAHIQQALMNLLVNAGEAARERVGVHVSEAGLPAEVRFASPEAPDPGTTMCRITVWDDGPGFATDALANLFEPFWTGKPQGHGLGLAAVRGIVGTHGGAIDVRSDSDGARVDVYLPISARPELALPELAATRHTGREKVWLVDDEEALLEFARIALQASGYHVRTFSRGASAVDAARTLPHDERPDVLVIDVVMPEMDGPSTVTALRELGIDAQLLWTSGYSPERARVPPTGHFLQKPFAGSELGQAIARLVTLGEGAA